MEHFKSGTSACAPLHFLRFGTPRSSEAKVPTINKRREGWTSLKTKTDKNIFVLGTTKEIKDPQIFARIAQLVEQGFCKPQVVGSNPIPSSRQQTEY